MINKIIYKASKITLAIALFQAYSINTKADLFSLEDMDTTEYKRHYNSLPEVDDADSRLKSSNLFPSFLKKAEKIVVQYELEPYVGLRLIHHHFLVGSDQVRAEKYQIYKERPSLITSTYEIEEASKKKMIPASWIFPNRNEEEAKIFETSNDSAVHAGSKMIQQNPEFLDEMTKLLEDHELSNLLSVAILKREALLANEKQVYLETDNSEQNQSIVQLWDVSKQSEKNSIRTSWSFKGPREQKCEKVSFCVKDGPKHRPRRNHQKS